MSEPCINVREHTDKKAIRGFPTLNLSRIGLIEQIWMTLGIVKINSCVTSKM